MNLKDFLGELRKYSQDLSISVFWGSPKYNDSTKAQRFSELCKPMGLNRFQHVIPFAQEYTKPNGFVAFDHNGQKVDPNISLKTFQHVENVADPRLGRNYAAFRILSSSGMFTKKLLGTFSGRI